MSVSLKAVPWRNMIHPLTIRDAAIPYILFQRTAYLRFPVAPVYRALTKFLPFPTSLYNIVVAIEARFGRARIKQLYQDDMRQEYLTIKPVLPAQCSSVLDIGCGVAGIDVFIQRHYADQPIDFFLLDKSHVEKNVFYLFKPDGAFYNSLDVSRTMLTDNGIDAQRVHLREATEHDGIDVDRKTDLVISLLSWGFHYPVATYVEQVCDLLSDDGIVIVDVRKGTDGVDVLRQKFQRFEVLLDTSKYKRVAVQR